MANRKYEAFYIVKPEFTDAEVQKIADRFKAVVEDKGGNVEAAAKWDKRKLAYEINGFKEGNYILMNFDAPADLPAELNRLMRISDDVIRHRVFLQTHETVKAEEAPVAAEPAAEAVAA